MKNHLTIFFSLPFYPVYKKNLFFNGHIALGIEDKVYQIFNPYLLKSDFLVSIMPVDEWLFNDSDYWVDRDKDSKTYTYVHLYKKGELKRTTLFYCSLEVSTQTIQSAKDFFYDIENRFKSGSLKFRVFQDNCSGLIADFFYKEKLIKKNFFDFIPYIFFKNLVKNFYKKNLNFKTGIFLKELNNSFKIHNFLFPFIFNPKVKILKWIKKYNFIDN